MLIPSKTITRFKYLKNVIAKHDELYYKNATSEISDQAYDSLKKEYESMLKDFPDLGDITGSLNVIGDDRIDGFKRYLHREPMLSLDNTYNELDFLKFANKIIGEDKNDIEFTIEPKIDGVAVSLTYTKGKLTRALTRGNGTEGDDVTQNIKLIGDLPLEIKADASSFTIPNVMEIRGEVYMRHDEFNRINQDRSRQNLELFKNPRNLAAGTIKLLDKNEALKRNLNILMHGIGAFEPQESFKSQTMVYEKLKAWKFPVIKKLWICKSSNHAWNAIKELDNLRNSFSFPTDGAVIKVNDFKQQKILGSTSKAPKFAIAYKFESEKVETIIHDIQLQIGRTGTITPVAILEPIQLAGTLVSRATLHNEDEISRKDIRIGDLVLVQKAGEIIPQILSVNLNKRKINSEKFSFYEHLEKSNIKAERIRGGSAWKITSINNSDQKLREIIHFSSKASMDISNLGISIIKQLIDHLNLKNASDLYSLSKDDFLKLDKIKEKSAHNLYESIQSSKNQPFWRLIHGLGIPNVGKQSAKDLANHFNSIKRLKEASNWDLTQIEGIGENVATNITQWFCNPLNLEIIENLKNHGVNMEKDSNIFIKESILKDKSIVLTGKLETMTRDEAIETIEKHGGKVSASLSNKTDYLLLGSSAGSKLNKAKSLGTKILNENEFEKLIRDNPS